MLLLEIVHKTTSNTQLVPAVMKMISTVLVIKIWVTKHVSQFCSRMTRDLRTASNSLLWFQPSTLEELYNPKHIIHLPLDISQPSQEMVVWVQNNPLLMRLLSKMNSTCHQPQETVYSNHQDKVSTMKVDLLILSVEDLIHSRQVLVESKVTLNKEWAFLIMMVFHKEKSKISEINSKWSKKYLIHLKM